MIAREKLHGRNRQEFRRIDPENEAQRNERLQPRIRGRAGVGLAFFQLLIRESRQPRGVRDAFLSQPRAQTRTLEVGPE